MRATICSVSVDFLRELDAKHVNVWNIRELVKVTLDQIFEAKFKRSTFDREISDKNVASE